jgi:hypothetical protein
MTNPQNFPSKKQVAEFHHDQHFQHYLTALSLMWQGEASKCIDYLSAQLTKNSEHRFALPLYRLWVEVLASGSERASLSLLLPHLARRQEEADERVALEYFGLRGIIHYELDEWEAVELLYATLKDQSHARYCQEFCLSYTLRKNPEALTAGALWQDAMGGDYLQWKLAALCLQVTGNHRELERLLAHSAQLFPLSPLRESYLAHGCIDKGAYGAAREHSRWLQQTYPKNSDYYILASYIELNRGKFTTAIALLKKAALLPGRAHDPDLAALLSYAYRHLSPHANNAGGWQQARRTMEEAEYAYHRLGISCPQLRLPFQEHQALPQEKTDNILQFAAAHREISTWLVAAAPSAFHTLVEGQLSEITYLVQSLDREAKTNDLVFFTVPHPWEKAEQRIVALYYVVGNAGWQLQGGERFNLKLVKRFRAPLSVAFPWGQMKKIATEGEGQVLRGAQQVVQLDQKQLGMINQELENLTASRVSVGQRAKSS